MCIRDRSRSRSRSYVPIMTLFNASRNFRPLHHSPKTLLGESNLLDFYSLEVSSPGCTFTVGGIWIARTLAVCVVFIVG
jgi:hypothetical protein